MILFQRAEVRCYACDQVGLSKVNPLYKMTFGLLVLITWVVYELRAPLPLGYFGIMGRDNGMGWILFAGMAVATLFSKNAHSCEKCGSQYLTPL
jgi:hypothetical protein